MAACNREYRLYRIFSGRSLSRQTAKATKTQVGGTEQESDGQSYNFYSLMSNCQPKKKKSKTCKKNRKYRPCRRKKQSTETVLELNKDISQLL